MTSRDRPSAVRKRIDRKTVFSCVWYKVQRNTKHCSGFKNFYLLQTCYLAFLVARDREILLGLNF